jgi:hypothetical protein
VWLFTYLFVAQWSKISNLLKWLEARLRFRVKANLIPIMEKRREVSFITRMKGPFWEGRLDHGVCEFAILIP